MPRPPHFEDLSRRYLEADWVSEFQRIWAIFNRWLAVETSGKNDRECVERFKRDARLYWWVHLIEVSFEPLASDDTKDGLAGSGSRFLNRSPVSDFFGAVSASPVIEPRIHKPWRMGSEPRVHKTNAITLNLDQFVMAYRINAQLLYEGIADFNLTLHQTLEALGVHARGCCFFRGPKATSLPASTFYYAAELTKRIAAEPKLEELANLINSAEPTWIEHDVVETLYNVRNVAVHGHLDFLNEWDNAAARAAYDLLDRLMRDIRDNW